MASNIRTDLHPQYITANSVMTAADTEGVFVINMPLPRVNMGSSGRSWCIEVIAVDWFYGSTLQASANTVREWNLYTGTFTAAQASGMGDGRAFCGLQQRLGFGTAVGFVFYPGSGRVELTDGAGNGFLVASDTMTLRNSSSGTTAAQDITVKIWYRFVSVGMAEFVGIVQSQQ